MARALGTFGDPFAEAASAARYEEDQREIITHIHDMANVYYNDILLPKVERGELRPEMARAQKYEYLCNVRKSSGVPKHTGEMIRDIHNLGEQYYHESLEPMISRGRITEKIAKAEKSYYINELRHKVGVEEKTPDIKDSINILGEYYYDIELYPLLRRGLQTEPYLQTLKYIYINDLRKKLDMDYVRSKSISIRPRRSAGSRRKRKRRTRRHKRSKSVSYRSRKRNNFRAHTNRTTRKRTNK